MKRILTDNLKNLRGWQTRRKFVAFAVDDYASVRVASPAARQRMIDAGLDLSHQMDRYDAMETRQDLETLFEVLDSVRDGQGKPAKFTAYTLSTNPDFARIREDGKNYHAESVTDTFARLATEQPQAYEGAWTLWQEGRARGLIQPQCHGREHFNVELFEHKLRSAASDMQMSIANDSVAAVDGAPAFPGVGFSHAFGLHHTASLSRHREILADAFDQFERLWGMPSTTFTPPALQLHPSLYPDVEAAGVLSIDKPMRCVRPMGDGTSRRELNRSGRQVGQNHLTVVRNVVFEPGKDMGFDPVNRAVQQIAAAFRWRKPAIISSHRVNFCGHLEESNRQRGLAALKSLLEQITVRWPDVEFVGVDDIVRDMERSA